LDSVFKLESIKVVRKCSTHAGSQVERNFTLRSFASKVFRGTHERLIVAATGYCLRRVDLAKKTGINLRDYNLCRTLVHGRSDLAWCDLEPWCCFAQFCGLFPNCRSRFAFLGKGLSSSDRHSSLDTNTYRMSTNSSNAIHSNFSNTPNTGDQACRERPGAGAQGTTFRCLARREQLKTFFRLSP